MTLWWPPVRQVGRGAGGHSGQKMAQNPLRVYFVPEWPLLGGLFSELFCSDRSKWDLHWIALEQLIVLHIRYTRTS